MMAAAIILLCPPGEKMQQQHLPPTQVAGLYIRPITGCSSLQVRHSNWLKEC